MAKELNKVVTFLLPKTEKKNILPSRLRFKIKKFILVET